MLCNLMKCGAVLVCCVLALTSLSASTGDKKEGPDNPALSGSWVKQAGELKIEFAAKDTLKIAPHGSDDVLVILCNYTVEKGNVKAKVSGFEGKEEAKERVKGHLPVGTEFSFQWEVKGDTAALDKLKSDKADVLKSRLEGKYDPKM